MKKRLIKKVTTLAVAATLLVAGASYEKVHASAADDYTYLYAGLTWNEYYENEPVYHAGVTTSSEQKDSHNETDLGGFDAVSRATKNHGLHRGSYQCDATITDVNGKTYELAGWSEDGKKMILKDGTVLPFAKGTLETADGKVAMDSYQVLGLKYVPVAVKNDDVADFKTKYDVVENGGTLFGGYGEMQLAAYSVTANVTADTNGLKVATKQSDGSYAFAQRKTGKDSGIAGETLKTAENVTPEVKKASGSYGEFLRVDINGDGYGALGAKMQTAIWTYYGKDASRTTALATYGTKFAADNWMHKAMGIQLGLTKSERCQLPTGYDGTGYWSLTITALGYADYTFDFEATAENIVVVKTKVQDKSRLEAAIASANGLNEADYTPISWEAFKKELEEANDMILLGEYQEDVDEATEHLNLAMQGLVSVQAAADTTATQSEADVQEVVAQEAESTQAAQETAQSKEAVENVENGAKAPSTGDTANYGWFALLAMASVGAAVFAGKKKAQQ